ncbi:hypothetical protein G6F37_006737 [Rhizopus arrhizus]|nr:hypothetical protein G6F38_011352 [Rhizopus arrhizus]KAG1157402.1 hypothetical protein G6F37_006737 [Rhizopus arrhizus]
MTDIDFSCLQTQNLSRERLIKITSSLVENSEQFLKSTKDLLDAFTQSDAKELKIALNDIVNQFDSLNLMVGVIKLTNPIKMIQTIDLSDTVSEKNRLNFSEIKQTELDKPIIKEEVEQRMMFNSRVQVNDSERLQPMNDKIEKNMKHLSSTQFLEQFEKTANDFAQSNHLSLNDVWKFLLVHAVPPKYTLWVKENLVNRYSIWSEAKAAYLHQFPDKIDKKPVTYRQERYAEYLLQLQMKEFDPISEFNEKFGTFSKNACMNLYDPSLLNRYIRSLSPKYRLLLTEALQKPTTNQPHSLDDLMRLTTRLVNESNQQNITSAYASPPYSYVNDKHLYNNQKRLVPESKEETIAHKRTHF